MKFVAVLPSIHEPWTKACLESCAFPEHVLVIDNTITNRGVAASWNLGIDAMVKRDADWLVILSAAVRFGPSGGYDFLTALNHPRHRVAVEAGGGIGWHLIAFPRRVIRAVGRFDPIFHPAYMEDIDYAHRIALTFDLNPPYWDKVDVDATIEGVAHGIHVAGVKVDGPLMRRLYVTKWGGPKGHETYRKPYGRHALSHTGPG